MAAASSSLPSFLTKTYEIFNTKEYNDCCGWGSTGETIVIKKIEQFSKTVLPKYFKHSNFQSFVRQLNMYDFRKTVQDPNHGEFQHPNFQRDKPDLLSKIKRKAHHKPSENVKRPVGAAGTQKHSSSGAVAPLAYDANDFLGYDGALMDHSPLGFGHDDLAKESDAVLNEMMKQKFMRDEFEKRMQEMEVESARIAGENVQLKQLVAESRAKQVRMQDKMEKVLKTMYNIFTGNGAGGNNSLGNAISFGNASIDGNASMVSHGLLPPVRETVKHTSVITLVDTLSQIHPKTRPLISSSKLPLLQHTLLTYHCNAQSHYTNGNPHTSC